MEQRNEKGQFIKGHCLGNRFKKGGVPWNKGRANWEKRTCQNCGEKFDFKIKKSNKKYGKVGRYCCTKCRDEDYSKRLDWSGSKNNNWKGNDVGYSGFHKRLQKEWGKPLICELCGKKGGEPKNYHWSSKDHKYSEDRKDWQRVCNSCHAKYDKKMGFI